MGNLKKAVRLALCMAVVGVWTANAQLNVYADSFNGATLSTQWDATGGAALDKTQGYNHLGCLRINSASTTASATSLNLWSGAGFPKTANGIHWTFWYSDSTAGNGHAIDVHIDMATTGAGGACGWWNYINQINYPLSAWDTTWSQDYDVTIPDWGAIMCAWGGTTMRQALINWLDASTCVKNTLHGAGTAADTTLMTCALIWRVNVTMGTFRIGIWYQKPVVLTSVEPSVAGKAQNNKIAYSAQKGFLLPSDAQYAVSVHTPDGRLVSKYTGYGSSAGIPHMQAGAYVVRLNSAVGNAMQTVVVQ